MRLHLELYCFQSSVLMNWSYDPTQLDTSNKNRKQLHKIHNLTKTQLPKSTVRLSLINNMAITLIKQESDYPSQ